MQKISPSVLKLTLTPIMPKKPVYTQTQASPHRHRQHSHSVELNRTQYLALTTQ